MPKTLIQAIATCIDTMQRCRTNNHPALESWEAHARELADLLPSGSGFDRGTICLGLHEPLEAKVQWAGNRVEFKTWFHHMDDHGSYCGWTEHKVVVRAEFDGFTVRVFGSNKRDILEYIQDSFYTVLDTTAPEFKMVTQK